jgi:hypothetical protein
MRFLAIELFARARADIGARAPGPEDREGAGPG